MTAQNSNRALQILTGVLALLLIVLGIYTYNFYNEEKEEKAILNKEKDLIETELNELITKYDNAIALNEVMDDHLLKAKERIVILLDSIKENEANVALIAKYRRQIGRLKRERDKLFQLADSLTSENQRLATNLDSTSIVLSQNVQLSDSLKMENTQLAGIVEKGAMLTASNLKVEGVKVKNNGKLYPTSKASRTEKIHVCFTLAKNAIAESGDKELFVQVINPESDLVGDKATANFEDVVLTYSSRNNVYYENEALDVCMLVSISKDDLVKGNYIVHVFSGSEMIANSQFSLK